MGHYTVHAVEWSLGTRLARTSSLQCYCHIPLSLETYDEEHAEGLQGGYEAGKRAQVETGSLCNPSIPIDPPKVCNKPLDLLG